MVSEQRKVVTKEEVSPASQGEYDSQEFFFGGGILDFSRLKSPTDEADVGDGFGSWFLDEDSTNTRITGVSVNFKGKREIGKRKYVKRVLNVVQACSCSVDQENVLRTCSSGAATDA